MNPLSMEGWVYNSNEILPGYQYNVSGLLQYSVGGNILDKEINTTQYLLSIGQSFQISTDLL